MSRLDPNQTVCNEFLLQVEHVSEVNMVTFGLTLYSTVATVCIMYCSFRNSAVYPQSVVLRFE